MKKNVLIIFGGYSSEYYVSCKSAADVLEFIDNDEFNVYKVGISIYGKWFLTCASPDEIRDGKTWLNNKDNKTAILSPERGSRSLLILNDNSFIEQKIDCVFPLIHGYGGEDGKLQGLLELLNIPYVGSGVHSSANAMDKAISGMFADLCGIKRPKCKVLYKKDYKIEIIKSALEEDFNYPVFIKPANAGSSVGVSKVENIDEIQKALEEAFIYDDKIIIEEGILGKEIKVAILEDSQAYDKIIVGEMCEITIPHGNFNDYDTKYVKLSSNKKIPADIDECLANTIKNQAIKIFKALECRGFARVDFFLNDSGDIYFNEINTIPGFGKNSIYSLMLEKCGLTYREIITKLIEASFNS